MIKLMHNNIASATGVTVLIVVLLINVSLIGIGSLIIKNDDSITKLYNIEIIPYNYYTMSQYERQEYLHNKHGGIPYETRELGYIWFIPRGIDVYYNFPDGTKMLALDYVKFIDGSAEKLDIFDYTDIILQFISFNPYILSYIGIIGIIIRVSIIICIIIALVDILWIG